MTSSVELPQYKCHKIVRAARITEMRGNGDGTHTLLFGEIGGEQVVGADWMVKHEPNVGGYFVRYDDDYTSWSPAAAFEDGYTKV